MNPREWVIAVVAALAGGAAVSMLRGAVTLASTQPVENALDAAGEADPMPDLFRMQLRSSLQRMNQYLANDFEGEFDALIRMSDPPGGQMPATRAELALSQIDRMHGELAASWALLEMSALLGMRAGFITEDDEAVIPVFVQFQESFGEAIGKVHLGRSIVEGRVEDALADE